MALLNQPPKATRSKESAPEVLSYRQRLYDRETLMLPNEPWDPAARLAQVRSRCHVWVWRACACGRARSLTCMPRLAPPSQMRDNYDRLVMELGVSPRGAARRAGGSSLEPVQLPRVPQGRHWAQGCGSVGKSSSSSGAQSARRVGYGRKAKGTGLEGGSGAQAVASARLVSRLDAMSEAGTLNATQAKRLRRLWTLQEQVANAAMRGDAAGAPSIALPASPATRC